MSFIKVKIGRDEQLLNTYDIVKCKPHGPSQSQIYIRRARLGEYLVAELAASELYERILQAERK